MRHPRVVPLERGGGGVRRHVAGGDEPAALDVDFPRRVLELAAERQRRGEGRRAEHGRAAGVRGGRRPVPQLGQRLHGGRQSVERAPVPVGPRPRVRRAWSDRFGYVVEV